PACGGWAGRWCRCEPARCSSGLRSSYWGYGGSFPSRPPCDTSSGCSAALGRVRSAPLEVPSLNAVRRPLLRWSPLVLALLLGLGCSPFMRTHETPATVRITLLHLNDVYQVQPLEQGRVGGLA